MAKFLVKILEKMNRICASIQILFIFIDEKHSLVL